MTTLDFALRVGPGAEVIHEWRDWRGQPYKTGPEFTVTRGQLFQGSNPLMAIPTDVWVRYQVRAAVGKGRAGKWDLTVTLPGEPPRRFDGLANISPDFDALTWIGFISNATEKTVFYLDDVDLSNKTP